MAGYSGDAGNAIMAPTANGGWISNGRRFSTPEVDHDEWSGGSCAAHESSGWWFRECSSSHINKVTDAIWLGEGQAGEWDVKAARMLVRLN